MEVIFLPDMIRIIKQASAEAIEEGKPVNLVYGVVENAEPLEIRIDQKLLLKGGFLVLTRNVTDYEVQMSSPPLTTVDGAGFRVLNSLKKGERVVMARMQGGQRFIVLDRIGE